MSPVLYQESLSDEPLIKRDLKRGWIRQRLLLITISAVVFASTPSYAQGTKKPPKRKEIPALTKPTQFWKPGSTIKVRIENPNTGNSLDDLLFGAIVKHEFERWEEYQGEVWGTNGLKFKFITGPPPFPPPEPPPPEETPDIVVKWVDQLPPDPETGKRPLGTTTATGIEAGTIRNQKDKNTGVAKWTETRVEITLARKSPETGKLRMADALALTIEHEIGHAEGLPHAGTGVMVEKGQGENQDKPVDLSGDAATKANKSAIQVPGLPLPRVPPVPVGNLEWGMNVLFSPSTNLFDYDYDIRSDPTGTSHFSEFAVYVGAEPEDALVPEGWDVDFAIAEPDVDFFLNGDFYHDPTGIGWLRFFTDDLSLAIDPGESLTFGFTSPFGPSQIAYQQVYGLTTAGDAQYLVLDQIPEPGSLGLITTGLFMVGFGVLRKRHDWVLCPRAGQTWFKPLRRSAFALR